MGDEAEQAFLFVASDVADCIQVDENHSERIAEMIVVRDDHPRPMAPTKNSMDERLKGWSAIAKYMGQPSAIVQRWAKSGMPVVREGHSVVASPGELSSWLGREGGGHGAAQILTNETDLSSVLRHGIKDARRNKKASPARQPRIRRKAPIPQHKLPPYHAVLPPSQVESRISGLEKRLQQLQELMPSLGAAERRKTKSEVKAINSAIAHYRAGLEVETSLEKNSRQA